MNALKHPKIHGLLWEIGLPSCNNARVATAVDTPTAIRARRATQDARPMRSENRALLIASIARGRRWLNELITEATTNTESIATGERFSVRKVNMTISLDFLAPDLAHSAPKR